MSTTMVVVFLQVRKSGKVSIDAWRMSPPSPPLNNAVAMLEALLYPQDLQDSRLGDPSSKLNSLDLPAVEVSKNKNTRTMTNLSNWYCDMIGVTYYMLCVNLATCRMKLPRGLKPESA